jgi:isopenicillin N synthase-like dioxygenase
MRNTPSEIVSGTKLPPPRRQVIEIIEKGEALPCLDLGPVVAGDPDARDQIAADVKRIQETLGFYTIVNYGFDPGVIDQMLGQARALFHLPEDKKLASKHEGHMQGYWPPRRFTNMRPGFENEQQVKKADISGWAFLRERDGSDPKVVGNMRHRAMNKWPDPALLPEFRPTLTRYHTEMLDLGLRLVKVYARSLGLPDDYFNADFENAEWYNRINYLQGNPDSVDVVGQTAHSDHSFITLLPLSAVPGLQVRGPSGSWINATYVPGAIVVNTGEWLSRKSNGRFLATPHRVLEPREERISMPFFLDPNDDATSEPVPTIMAPGEKPRFPTVGWHEFFLSYIDGYTNAAA